MLELRNVSKSFGAMQVLQPTTLRIERGRTTVLIGASGCGKTTLLRLMIGLLAPDQGEVLLNGEPVSSKNVLQMRQKMGYVLQDGGLFPHLTARQNVVLLAKFLRWNTDRCHDRVKHLSQLVRLPPGMLERYPLQLSAGQRQRVGIMRALMLDPDVLLLDEPMGALDPLVRYDLQEDMRSIFATLNKTVVLVTHDMGEAGFLGDSVVLLGEGRIVQSGTLDDLLRSPAEPYVARFVNAQRTVLGREGAVLP